jgi:hypothetical protein
MASHPRSQSKPILLPGQQKQTHMPFSEKMWRTNALPQARCDFDIYRAECKAEVYSINVYKNLANFRFF